MTRIARMFVFVNRFRFPAFRFSLCFCNQTADHADGPGVFAILHTPSSILGFHPYPSVVKRTLFSTHQNLLEKTQQTVSPKFRKRRKYL
jgi:hypothetical protein